MLSDSAAAKKYRLKIDGFQNALFDWKVENRMATKSEWKFHQREERLPQGEYGGESVGTLLCNSFMKGLKAVENETIRRSPPPHG